MEKVKIYYQNSTGYLCNRFPKDLPIEDENCFIEVTKEVEEETYTVEYGKFWAVINNQLQIVDDIETQSTEEYKRYLRINEISTLKSYLSETDYIVSKLNELQLEDETEYQIERNKYYDVLAKRKEARAKINELEVK